MSQDWWLHPPGSRRGGEAEPKLGRHSSLHRPHRSLRQRLPLPRASPVYVPPAALRLHRRDRLSSGVIHETSWLPLTGDRVFGTHRPVCPILQFDRSCCPVIDRQRTAFQRPPRRIELLLPRVPEGAPQVSRGRPSTARKSSWNSNQMLCNESTVGVQTKSGFPWSTMVTLRSNRRM